MSLASCEDVSVAKTCMASESPEIASKCWVSILATPFKVIVGKGDFTEGYLVGKTFAGSAVLCLPVRRERIGFHSVFVLEPVTKLHWISICAVESWKAQGFSWVSPLQLRLTTGKWLGDHLCVMLAKGPEETLLRHCAREGFYDMPKSALTALAKEVGCDIRNGSALPDVLLQLCSCVLPALTDEDKLCILRKRMPAMGDVEQPLVENEEAHELLEDKDVHILTKKSDEQKACVQDLKAMIDIWLFAKSCPQEHREEYCHMIVWHAQASYASDSASLVRTKGPARIQHTMYLHWHCEFEFDRTSPNLMTHMYTALPYRGNMNQKLDSTYPAQFAWSWYLAISEGRVRLVKA
eukprot:6463831-Amphidinium_carterae.1